MVVDTGETSARDGDRSTVVVTGLGKAGFQSCGTDGPTAEFGTDRGTVGTLGTDEARVWVAMRSLLVGESGPLSISGLNSGRVSQNIFLGIFEGKSGGGRSGRIGRGGNICKDTRIEWGTPAPDRYLACETVAQRNLERELLGELPVYR